MVSWRKKNRKHALDIIKSFTKTISIFMVFCKEVLTFTLT